MPASGGIHKAIERGKAIGCTAVQVFTSSPQMWKAKPVTPEQASAFKAACTETGIDCVVSHDSYLVNLCAPTDELRAKSIAGLSDEVIRCSLYGIRWVVSHIGAHLGQGTERGLEVAAQSLKEVFENSPDDVMVLAETTAGQGSSLDSRLDEVETLFDLAQAHPRLGVCVDTCHIFAAGYDIRTQEGYDSFWEELERRIGIDKVKAIHCNDSKKPLGSRVDRHAHIGEGELGLEPFRFLMNDPRFFDVPILLETPEAEQHHQRNLEVLLSLVK